VLTGFSEDAGDGVGFSSVFVGASNSGAAAEFWSEVDDAPDGAGSSTCCAGGELLAGSSSWARTFRVKIPPRTKTTAPATANVLRQVCIVGAPAMRARG